METLTRRGFLRGRARCAASAVRPPWALPEPVFIERCTRCNACLEVCPTDVIVCGDGGYPEVDFARGECTFCGDCATACRDGAFERDACGAPWQAKAAIGAACIALNGIECRVCGEQCATRAIRFRLAVGRMAVPVLDASACNGCGACVATCPASAITVTEPLAAAAAA